MVLIVLNQNLNKRLFKGIEKYINGYDLYYRDYERHKYLSHYALTRELQCVISECHDMAKFQYRLFHHPKHYFLAHIR